MLGFIVEALPTVPAEDSVASVGLVSPRAARWCHPIFSWKKNWRLFLVIALWKVITF